MGTEDEICELSLGSFMLLTVESIHLSLASKVAKGRFSSFLTSFPILAASMGSRGTLLEMIRSNVVA